MKPFYHTFLIYRMRRITNSDILEISKIREIIARVSTRNGGLPRNMIRYIIQDLIDLGLIVKFANEKYRIPVTPLETRIKGLMLASCSC